jgi:putative transposase
VRQAQHEAARTVIDWALEHRVGTLTVGDPRGVLDRDAGRRHNLRLRQWQIGRSLQILRDKAELAGITLHLVDERGTSSTCPSCSKRVPKPKGRTLSCPRCGFAGHRDLVAAATIATRTPGGATTTPTVVGVVTHRRTGRHLPGAGTTRRDPRRRPPAAAPGSLGPARPDPPPVGSRSPDRRGARNTPGLPGQRFAQSH